MVCLYHLPRICRTLVPGICVRPKIFRVFWYIDVITCVIYNSTEQQGRPELLVSAMKIIGKDRLVNAQTHGINGFSLLRQWSCSCPATYQRACACDSKWLMSLYFCFVDVHIDQAASLNWLQCLCVICECRAVYRWTVLRHHWHCCIFSYCHNIISSGSPPVFNECTSTITKLLS